MLKGYKNFIFQSILVLVILAKSDPLKAIEK